MESEKINQSKIEYSAYQERIQGLEQVLQEIEVDLNRVRQGLKDAIERKEDAGRDSGMEEKEANRQFLKRIEKLVDIEIEKYQAVIAGFEARKEELEKKIREYQDVDQTAQRFLENYNPEKQH